MAAPVKLSSAVSPIIPIASGDLRRDQDLTLAELRRLLDLAHHVKAHPKDYLDALRGHSLALLFEKPSLRTRLTFELAIAQMGGSSVTQTGMIGEREPLKDVARNLDGWVSGIVARTFSQQTVDDLAHWADIPVINALSDLYHPCQALADLQTIEERYGGLKGVKLTFIGDGNNVAHSLMLTATRLGMHFTLAHPRGYEPKPEIVAEARKFAAAAGGKVKITVDPEEGVDQADAVYTDVWASMGQEHEAYERMVHFEPYRVDEELMAKARKGAVFMHCLPAKRGQETTDGVMESRHSVVFQQAENRLHAQKALLLMLLHD
ncbi:MAG: ornithine carbamoyltransferase [Bryobacterales bacterium]|nr:ornithine carbamoyltransferase [Bryobacterales bacterium]